MRESFQYDALTSQMAAARGVIANAFDMFDTFALRRQHPPLLSYVILANNALFGSSDFAACVFSIVSGALTCVVVAVGVLVALGARRGAPSPAPAPAHVGVARADFLAALFAGWLLAFLPVHLFVSRSANWDALYALFSTSALVALARYVSRAAPAGVASAGGAVRAGRGTLYAAAALAALALATSEMGVFLAPPFLVAFAADARRLPRGELLARYGAAVALGLAILALLWPAGVFEAHLVRTVLQRASDSVLAAANHPWHTIYRDLATQSPAFAIAAALGFLACAPAIARALAAIARGKRDTPAAPHAPAARFAIAVAPLWIYAAVAMLLSVRQSWVHIHLKDDMFPPLAILGGCALAVMADARAREASVASAASGFGASAVASPPARRPRHTAAALALAAGVALVGISVHSATRTSDTMIVGPEEHPGYRGVAAFLARHPDSRAYYYYAPLVEFLMARSTAGEIGAPAAARMPRIETDAERAWTPEQIASVKSRAYDFVVTDFSFFDARYPDIGALAEAFAPEYALAQTVAHRRTGAAVAWIFARAK